MKQFKKKVINMEVVKESLLAILVVLFGAFGVARGWTWITDGDTVLGSAEVYKRAAQFIPIQTLGLVFLFGGLFVTIGGLTKGRFSYWMLLWGGLLSTFCGSIMYMASTIENLNLYTPLSVGIILSANIPQNNMAQLLKEAKVYKFGGDVKMEEGDLVIWDWDPDSTEDFGHVAVATKVGTTGMTIVEQNVDGKANKPVNVRTCNFNGVAWFIRPNFK